MQDIPESDLWKYGHRERLIPTWILFDHCLLYRATGRDFVTNGPFMRVRRIVNEENRITVACVPVHRKFKTRKKDAAEFRWRVRFHRVGMMLGRIGKIATGGNIFPVKDFLQIFHNGIYWKTYFGGCY